MSLLSELSQFTRFATGLRTFLRDPVTLDASRDAIRRRLDDREAHFLSMAERGIFAVPSSPYLPLLAHAGCDLADLRQMVRTRGIEATLTMLAASGVYVTFDEFKGRVPIVRNGRTLSTVAADFGNPLTQHHFSTETGGSTGANQRVSTDLARLAYTAHYRHVAYDAYGLTHMPKAMWRGLLPAGSGINYALTMARIGHPPDKWFTPLRARDLRSSKKYPLATYAMVALCRTSGVKMPWPEFVPMDRADVVARWVADAVRTHRRCFLGVTSSLALRVALAAEAAGLDLTGAILSGGGEPTTDARAARIGRSGAILRPTYFVTEAGAIGMSCANPVDANDQHLLADAVALVQRRRTVPGAAGAVEAFNVTSLLPGSPRLLFNVELDDYGTVERRDCGCPFGALGLTTHVRHIRSFRKLTGEGVTLVGSDMERILEVVLPARFGGSSLDYQLAEEEDVSGFTRLTVVVSPRITLARDTDVIEAVSAALAAGDPGADHARATWREAGTLRVARAEPVWTGHGKFLPLTRSPRRPSPARQEHTQGDS